MLSNEEKKVLLQIARRAIHDRLTLAPERSAQEIYSPTLLEKRGIFVTLMQGGRLRGCIGRTDPAEALYQTVEEVAKASAFQDPRFSPLTLPDLERTVIEISILSSLSPLSDVGTLRLGEHGVMVRRGYASGLLLPQVATEHRWGREEFLRQVCLKAGLPLEAWREKETELFTFTTEVFSEVGK